MGIHRWTLLLAWLLTLTITGGASAARIVQRDFRSSVIQPEALLGLGLLDVTKEPYHADPNGEQDSTNAIRRAVNDARDHGLVCFFPTGTYLISDTISCEQENYKLDTPRQVDGQIANYWHKNHKVILLGSTKGAKRPVIRLSGEAKGFDDPSSPKIAVWIWARTWFGDGTGEQPNIAFGHAFIGIDIDVRGHAGAIGLKFSGSQGSTLQDSTIFAEGAFAGLYNCPGQAAGTFNVEVNGGEYGFFADSKSRFPILVGCRFKNQTVAAIRYTNGGNQVPTLLVGCRIENRSGTAIDLSTEASYAGISLVDCVVEMDGGRVVATKKRENVFLENTYLKGAESIATGSRPISVSDRWVLVDRYSAHTDEGLSLVNGRTSAVNEVERWALAGEAPNYSAIREKHLAERPSFEDSDAVNVRDFGAKGDGETDDTAAFRQAIQSREKIYVPPGNYLVNGKLALRSETKLFSLSPFLTSIGIRREPGGNSGTGAESFTLVTPDSPDAAPELWFISVRGYLDWRSGRGVAMHVRAPYRFSGNAGGRLYAIVAMGQQFLLEKSQNPISFYSLNVERVTRNPQSLIRESKNVRIFYFKVEAGTRNAGEVGGGDENIPARIENSEDVRIYCMYGNVKGLGPQQAMLEVVNSRRLMVSQLKAFFSDLFPHLREVIGPEERTIPSSKIASLYVRD